MCTVPVLLKTGDLILRAEGGEGGFLGVGPDANSL